MTSPRQRKKKALILSKNNNLEVVELKNTQKVQQVVAPQQASVVESGTKPKKVPSKNALVETKAIEEKKIVETQKSQDPVVEQPKAEVKTSTGE